MNYGVESDIKFNLFEKTRLKQWRCEMERLNQNWRKKVRDKINQKNSNEVSQILIDY
jgi:hypothetical protein